MLPAGNMRKRIECEQSIKVVADEIDSRQVSKLPGGFLTMKSAS